jgi:hypothetical protein
MARWLINHRDSFTFHKQLQNNERRAILDRAIVKRAFFSAKLGVF